MKENSLDCFHLTRDNLLGSKEWPGKMDMLNIAIIGLAEELPEHDEQYELHRLLGALLSNQLTQSEKINIIENEYNIPMEEKFRKEVASMCNLSEGIEERGFENGYNAMIVQMYNEGYTLEQISKVAKIKEEEIEKIIHQSQAVTI